MNFPDAGAAFLPERLAKSARIRVLTLDSDRAELTEHVAGIPVQIMLKSVGWSSSSGRLKLEKTTKIISGWMRDIIV